MRPNAARAARSDAVSPCTEVGRCILANLRYAGVALWQLFDTRSHVNAGPDVRGKPRGFNCAGLLDEYWRPKLAYDVVKAAFQETGHVRDRSSVRLRP